MVYYTYICLFYLLIYISVLGLVTSPMYVFHQFYYTSFYACELEDTDTEFLINWFQAAAVCVCVCVCVCVIFEICL
jgi:hypothetical protein